SSSSLPSCLLVTCGEDGRLCAWKQATSGFAVESSSASSYGKCSKDFSMRNHRWPRGCLTNEKGGAMKRRPFCTPY
ncbi:wd g-beta repeat-containing protein, partial [Cystoisospora suis]